MEPSEQPAQEQPTTVETTPPQPPIFAPEQQPTITPPKKKRSVFRILIVILLTVVVAVVGGAAFYVISQNKKANQYTKQNAAILADLKSEMKKLKDDNFLKSQEVLSDFTVAVERHELHIKDEKNTEEKVKKLRTSYDQLRPTSKNKDEKAKSDQAFQLADSILEDYKDSLYIRRRIFDAYYNLPILLDQFVALYGTGGVNTQFIALCEKITTTAGTAYDELLGLEAKADDVDLLALRLDYLQRNESTFKTLGTYYATNDVKAISTKLSIFSAENIATNKKVTDAIKAYTTTSGIAKDFAALEDLLK